MLTLLLSCAILTSFMDPPQIIIQPGNAFVASTRRFQGIPSLARAPEGRLRATWYGGPGTGERLYYRMAPVGGGRTNRSCRALSTVTTHPSPAPMPDVSVVIPVCNEDENVRPLAQEIHLSLIHI